MFSSYNNVDRVWCLWRMFYLNYLWLLALCY